LLLFVGVAAVGVAAAAAAVVAGPRSSCRC